MSNLLEKASILTTPTAYNDGKLLSVKPNTSVGDFDFTRNSSATRVASNGLIEDVQILSGNLVTNGDFSEEGSELVTNGDFATDSDWTKASNWTISGGSANADGSSGGQLSQTTDAVIIGKTYKIEYTILNYVSGSFRFSYAGTSESFNTSDGTYTTYRVATSAANALASSSINFIGSIDNVSVKEVGQDWSLGNGWSIGDSKAVVDNTVNANLDQTCMTSGKKYKVSFEISDLQNGGIIKVGDIVTPGAYVATSNGENSFTYTATNPTLRVRAGGYPCSITNVSVKEITDDTNLPRIDYDGFSYQDALGSELATNGDFSTDSDWTKGTGWSISGGEAISAGSSGYSFLQQTGVFLNGKTYKVSYSVTSYTSGSVEVGVGGASNNNIQRNSVGNFVEYHTSNGTNLTIISRNLVGSIDNVSVKEYLGQEVVPDSGVGHILLEPQSTNLFAYSDASIGYSQTNVTISNNQGTSPDGTNNSTKMLMASGTGTHRVYESISSSLNDNNTFSVFIKEQSEISHIGLVSDTATELAWFSGLDGSIINANGLDAKTQSFSNGWHRISISYIADANDASDNQFIYFSDRQGTTPSVAFNGTETILMYGFQAEKLSFATSYIPTNGSTVTRLGETLNNAGSSDLINSTEGVLYAEIAALANSGNSRFISLSDGTNQNIVLLGYISTDNRIRIFVKSANSTSTNNTSTTVTVTNFNKIAIKYKENNFALWVNGTKTFSDTSGLTPIGLNQLEFEFGSANKFEGKVKCVAVYKEALTDEELTCLTTI